jgi:hypothetical protein
MTDTPNTEATTFTRTKGCPACDPFPGYSFTAENLCPTHKLLAGTTYAEIRALALAQAAGSEPQS